MKEKTMEEIGVDFSGDSNLSEMKNTLFVVDPSQSFMDMMLPKTMGYASSLSTFNLKRAEASSQRAFQSDIWAEEDIVREDVREDARDNRDTRADVSYFRKFIKSEICT